MSDAQQAAFLDGTGGLAAGDVLIVVAAVVAAFYLLWLAWLALNQYRAWWAGDAELVDLIWVVLRGAIMVMLVGYFVRP